MKNLFLLTSAAMLMGTASFAAGKLDRIAASFTAQGYTNIQVSQSRGNVTVTAEKDGLASTFAAQRDAGKHFGKGKGKSKMKTKAKDGGIDGSGDDVGIVVGDDDGTEDQVGDDDGTEDQVGDGLTEEDTDVGTPDDSETD